MSDTVHMNDNISLTCIIAYSFPSFCVQYAVSVICSRHGEFVLLSFLPQPWQNHYSNVNNRITIYWAAVQKEDGRRTKLQPQMKCDKKSNILTWRFHPVPENQLLPHNRDTADGWKYFLLFLKHWFHGLNISTIWGRFVHEQQARTSAGRRYEVHRHDTLNAVGALENNAGWYTCWQPCRPLCRTMWTRQPYRTLTAVHTRWVPPLMCGCQF